MVSNYLYPYQYLDANFRKDLAEENAIWFSLYQKMRSEGINNLVYLDLGANGIFSDSCFGPDNEGTVDGVHLTDLGFHRLAKEYLKVLEQ